MGLILLLLLLIILVNVIYYSGLYRCFGEDLRGLEGSLPVSVVVAARNERDNVLKTIAALQKQNYPYYELIVVDDYSEDDTYELLDKSPRNFKLLKNTLEPGKKHALACGINCAANELILITDADCLPEKKWISSFVKKFGTATVRDSENRATKENSATYDLLFGIAPFLMENNFVNHVSCFENLRGFMLSVSALGLNMPYSAAARSLAFRKSSFEQIGGYDNTMEIPFGDDGLLIREAVKNKLKIGFVHYPDSFVYTKSKSSWKDYFLQRKRHTTTSFYYSTRSKILLAAWHLVNLLPLPLLFLTPINFYFSLPLITKLLFDSFQVLKFQKKFGYKFPFYKIIFYQVVYEGVLLIHFVNALKGWKKKRLDDWMIG